MDIHFFKVKGINAHANFENISVYRSMDSLVEWLKMDYARDCFWIKEKDFYDEVKIPTTRPTDSEIYGCQEKGWKKYWNYHLAKLISAKEKGELLNKILDGNFNSIDGHFVFFVIEIGGEDVFVNLQNFDKEDIDALKLEDVTNEYVSQFFEAINSKEIEDYVETHSQDEIENRYATKWIKEHSENFSMWEL